MNSSNCLFYIFLITNVLLLMQGGFANCLNFRKYYCSDQCNQNQYCYPSKQFYGSNSYYNNYCPYNYGQCNGGYYQNDYGSCNNYYGTNYRNCYCNYPYNYDNSYYSNSNPCYCNYCWSYPSRSYPRTYYYYYSYPSYGYNGGQRGSSFGRSNYYYVNGRCMDDYLVNGACY